MEYGKWNYREISNLSEEEVKDFYKYCEKLARLESRDGDNNNSQGIVTIVDWDGFALKNFASREGEICIFQRVFSAIFSVQFN